MKPLHHSMMNVVYYIVVIRPHQVPIILEIDILSLFITFFKTFGSPIMLKIKSAVILYVNLTLNSLWDIKRIKSNAFLHCGILSILRAMHFCIVGY